MKLRQDYKLVNNLKKLIKNGDLSQPVEFEEICFDVETHSFTVENKNFDLRIKASKKTSSIYAPLYTVTIKDPEYKVLDEHDVKNGRLTEKDSALAKLIFNRLQKYYKSGK